MIRQEVYEGIESATGSVSATLLPELYVDDGQSDPSLEMLPYIPDDPSSIITTFVQSEGVGNQLILHCLMRCYMPTPGDLIHPRPLPCRLIGNLFC